MSTPEQARAEQLAYGRQTLRTSEGYRARTDAPTRPYDRSASAQRAPMQRTGSKGHDVILKAMQESGQHATLITADGVKFEGVITGRDKFTITLRTKHPDAERAERGETIRRVFYKSAIEQFWGEEARRDIHDATRDEQGISELKALSKAVVN